MQRDILHATQLKSKCTSQEGVFNQDLGGGVRLGSYNGDPVYDRKIQIFIPWLWLLYCSAFLFMCGCINTLGKHYNEIKPYLHLGRRLRNSTGFLHNQSEKTELHCSRYCLSPRLKMIPWIQQTQKIWKWSRNGYARKTIPCSTDHPYMIYILECPTPPGCTYPMSSKHSLTWD